MTFQASDSKENQFLDLLDNDDNIIKPSYIKGGPWLKVFVLWNALDTNIFLLSIFFDFIFLFF